MTGIGEYRRAILLYSLLIAGVLTFTGLLFYQFEQDQQPHSTKPDGSKWRIAYYEGGPFGDYAVHFMAFVRVLMQEGWMQPLTIPEDLYQPVVGNNKPLWEWLAANAESEYLTFIPDGYYSAGWNETNEAAQKTKFIQRLNKDKDIDFIIGMGTAAGLDLANNEHSVPLVIFSASDPVKSGIIRSAEDSGYDHVHAKCDPEKYIRQVRTFHRIVGYKKLGVVLEDSTNGRVYANIADLEQVAAENGFEIIEAFVPETDQSEEACRIGVAAAFSNLAPRIDALWISTHLGERPDYMPANLEPLFQYRIPTWSQLGPRHVRRGVLFSIAETNMEDIGAYYVNVMSQIFKGVQPRDIPQHYHDPKTLAINMETANRIGFPIPRPLKKSADVVYTNIEDDILWK